MYYICIKYEATYVTHTTQTIFLLCNVFLCHHVCITYVLLCTKYVDLCSYQQKTYKKLTKNIKIFIFFRKKIGNVYVSTYVIHMYPFSTFLVDFASNMFM